MDSAGLCSICGKAGVMYACSMCGRVVCRDCITVRGVCKPCLGGATMSIEDYRKKGFDVR